MKRILYDVCNDYSLDPADDQTQDLSAYRKKIVQGGIVYIHKEYDEIHYFKGQGGLKGMYLHNGRIVA